MGMNAELIATGSFRAQLVPHLPWTPGVWAKVTEGAPVLFRLFLCEIGSSQSRELAACFGIDPWDFNAHHLNPGMADIPRLREVLGEQRTETFLVLRDAVFRFFFKPNG